MKHDIDSGSEVREHGSAIEWDDLVAAVWVVHGQEASVETEAIACEVGINVDLQNLDFEDVAGLGFFNRDGAGEDVAAGTFVGHLFVDRGGVGRDIFRLDTAGDETVGWAAGREGLHRDGVARVDGEYRFGGS